MNKIHIISENQRLRLGDWGIYTGVLILEERRKRFFGYYWKRIDFTVPSVHKSIEEAAKYLLWKAKSSLSTSNIDDLYDE